MGLYTVSQGKAWNSLRGQHACWVVEQCVKPPPRLPDIRIEGAPLNAFRTDNPRSTLTSHSGWPDAQIWETEQD